MAKKKKKIIAAPKGPLEWIYVLDENRTMREIYETLRDQTSYQMEYWEEAGVIELSFEETGGIDFEQSEDQDLLWVTLSPKAYDKARESLKEIEKLCGGKFSPDQD